MLGVNAFSTLSRSGGVIDPFGNKWYIATHIKNM